MYGKYLKILLLVNLYAYMHNPWTETIVCRRSGAGWELGKRGNGGKWETSVVPSTINIKKKYFF